MGGVGGEKRGGREVEREEGAGFRDTSRAPDWSFLNLRRAGWGEGGGRGSGKKPEGEGRW